MRFQLVRYFTATSLVAFIIVAVVLGYAYREVSTRRLVELQEANHVTLTRQFANTLWAGTFAPHVEATANLSKDALAQAAVDASLDAKILGLMRGTSTFKVKVFDLAGRTVYSSERKQIGEDKRANAGFRSARSGSPSSELTHRDSFSAFEGVVEDRDLISSYVPVAGPGGRIEGVFEIYSDVTPFLDAIERTQWQVVGLVVILLGALYGALYLIVRRADGILRRQEAEQEQAQQRVAQSEKMAGLGQMVAGVAHQLNTPIAFMKSNTGMMIEGLQQLDVPVRVGRGLIGIARQATTDDVQVGLGALRPWAATNTAPVPAITDLKQMAEDMLGGLDQMSELVVNLREFTRLDRSRIASFDLNRGLRNVIYIARSSMPTGVTVVEDLEPLPSIACNPSQLNQVFLNLVNNAAQAIEGTGTVVVRSRREAGGLRVDVEDDGRGIPAEVRERIFEPYFTTRGGAGGTGLGLSIARDIVEAHGGRITVTSVPGQTVFTVSLPLPARAAEPAPGVGEAVPAGA